MVIKQKRFLIVFLLIVIVVIASMITFSFSIKLDNDSKVEANSELVYYLDVTYDGVDKHGVESNDQTRSSISSDSISIEDRIPDGLIFNGFVVPEGELYGAVSRDGSNGVCSGTIVGDSTEARSERTFTWMSDNIPLHTVKALWGNFVFANEIDSTPTKPGYIFEGWSEPIYDENLNVIYKAIFRVSKEMDYTVSWYDSETNEYIAAPETRRGSEGSEVVPTTDDKEKGSTVGYQFDASNPNNITSVILSEDGPNELKLYFKYNPSQVSKVIPYKVIWANLDGSELKSETRNGENLEMVTILNSDKQYPNYIFDESNPNNITSIVLSEEGPNELKLYFKLASETSLNTAAVNGEEQTNGDYTYSFHGLHYNEKTRTVSFKVKNLQAGCKLRIGIKTIVPLSADDSLTEQVEVRRDFYNFASSEERNKTKYSNTVHSWMGEENTLLYKVSYAYIGDVPGSAPSLMNEAMYSGGTKVGVALEPKLAGYKFSGWKADDVTVENGSFSMPNHEVTFVGSFQKDTPFSVSYSIEGEMPPNYVPPSNKEYYAGDVVPIDALKKGDIFNGYRFLGWSNENVEINDNEFVMPENDLVFTGNFEEVRYKVEYQFISETLPSNSNTLLPETKYYAPGEIVNLSNIDDVANYHFLGWYQKNQFVMPEEDVLIKGEWQYIRDYFRPTIKKEILNKKVSYQPGDVVNYRITVMNNANYAINNILVEEKNKKLSYTKNANFEIMEDGLIHIPTIQEKSSLVINAKYTVEEQDIGIISNEAQIIEASALNDYYLDTSIQYRANTEFSMVGRLNICNTFDQQFSKELRYHITDNTNYDTWFHLNSNECKNVTIQEGEYEITEIVPQEYVLEEIQIDPDQGFEKLANKIKVTVGVGEKYNVTFRNTFKSRGFYKSGGSVLNQVQPKYLYEEIKNNALQKLNGVQTLATTNSKLKKPIYYMTSTNVNNHVIFAGFCWSIIRTTDTEGVKLLYNGKPNNGVCNNTGTNSIIGTSQWNPTSFSLAYAGYMYNDVIYGTTKSVTSALAYSTSYTYSNGRYTLSSSRTSDFYSDFTNKYTCLSTATSCSTLYYIYYTSGENDLIYGLSLVNGKSLDDVINLSLNNSTINKKDSTIKAYIDKWYKANMTGYTKYLEDTVWCNDRSKAYNNGNVTNLAKNHLGSGIYLNSNTSSTILVCPRKMDSFTVSNSVGNQALTYPVGLLTRQERILIKPTGSSKEDSYWTMTPHGFVSGTRSGQPYQDVRLYYTSVLYEPLPFGTYYGVRPSISLKPKTTYISGNGTTTSPYLINAE